MFVILNLIFVILRFNVIGYDFVIYNFIGIGFIYLGWFWWEYVRVVFIDIILGEYIVLEGWVDWMIDIGFLFVYDYVYFGEFNSIGLGVNFFSCIGWFY